MNTKEFIKKYNGIVEEALKDYKNYIRWFSEGGKAEEEKYNLIVEAIEKLKEIEIK